MLDKIYLACPYTAPDEETRNFRQRAASRIAASLMQTGVVVFSPITHGHQVAEFLPEALLHSHDFWMVQCLPILKHCNVLVILPLPGWRDSQGLKEELRYAEYLGHELVLLQPETPLQYNKLNLEVLTEAEFAEFVDATCASPSTFLSKEPAPNVKLN